MQTKQLSNSRKIQQKTVKALLQRTNSKRLSHRNPMKEEEEGTEEIEAKEATETKERGNPNLGDKRLLQCLKTVKTLKQKRPKKLNHQNQRIRITKTMIDGMKKKRLKVSQKILLSY